jgi:hypothetical protein
MADPIINPPAQVRPAADLAALAAEINAEHALGEQATRQAAQHYLRVGRALLQAREQCPHGQWLPWLAANCPGVSERTSQRCMSLARTAGKSDAASDLLAALWRNINGHADAEDQGEAGASGAAPGQPRILQYEAPGLPPAPTRRVTVVRRDAAGGLSQQEGRPQDQEKGATAPPDMEVDRRSTYEYTRDGIDLGRWSAMLVTADAAEDAGDATLAAGWRWLAANRRWPLPGPARHRAGCQWTWHGGGPGLSCDLEYVLPAAVWVELPRKTAELPTPAASAICALEVAARAVGRWLAAQGKAQ